MITFDGDRSLKRRWFAKKKLAQIKEMDIPAACPIWDGFRFKVWQLNKDLDGGRVAAPMGAVVTCSTQDGIKIAVADYWAGGFNPAQDLYVMFKDLGVAGEFTTFFNSSIDPLTGYYPMKFVPSVNSSYFGLVDGDTSGPDTVLVEDYSSYPVLLPQVGELYNILVSDYLLYDFTETGGIVWWQQMFEKNTSFYIANGSQQSRIDCVAKRIEYADGYAPWVTYYKTGADRYTSAHNTWLYDFVGDPLQKTVGYTIDVMAGVSGSIRFIDIVTDEIPITLRNIFVTSENDGSCEPVGSYAFDGTLFHAVNASTHLYSSGHELCEASEYYDDNPEHDHWRLFYSMVVNGNVNLVNSSQFLALLDDLATEDCLTDWFNAKRMFEQLVGAFPNTIHTVPYDSVMFHDHAGIIYTWTRKYGAVKFTATGLFLATVLVPSQVSGEEGVRPDITYAGVFDDTHLYLCVSNKVKVGVRAVHYGSPFTGWTALPGCSDGVDLISVRPCMVTPEKIFLIGVVKYTVNDVEKYAFASLNWIPESTDLWQIMGELPFPVGNADNFALGLYGDDPRADALASYQCPPIVPQSPVGPYDKYAIGMP